MTTIKIFITLLLLSLFGCTCGQQSSTQNALTIKIDGSSTVFPLTEAISEEFSKANQNIKVTVGTSGTGGGFKKLSVGEIDICNASRSIKPEEITSMKKNNLDYLELPVAYDGITLVVNAKNDWVDNLTTEELKRIWSPDTKVKTWKDIRSQWPNRTIKLYGPGTDSGTFDFFTEVIVGKARASRSDYTKSEDDNVLVQGIVGDLDSLGYFGYSYYKAHKNKLRAVAIKDKESVLPSEDSIISNKYTPLSRPLYIYVNKSKSSLSEYKKYIQFYLTNAELLSHEVGFVPLPSIKYKELLSKL